tara:strand:- start:351 stop:1151 length:801 start_codon:yes stop_codon:yes gene_type:complete
MLSALLLMGAPCAQEDHDDHHECPPAAAPDAGDLQSLCQEQFPAPDAGVCPECDDCSDAPTVGVDEPGMIHNLVLGHLAEWIETADLKAGDPDNTKIDAVVNEAKRMACARKVGVCAEVEAKADSMAQAFKLAYAARIEGQPLSAVFLSPESLAAMGDNAPPQWAVDAMKNLEREIVSGDKTVEELHAIIAQMGMGEGKYNGGNLGRIMRSIGKDSLTYWEGMATDNDWEDQIHRHWVMSDLGFGLSWGPLAGACASGLHIALERL